MFDLKLFRTENKMTQNDAAEYFDCNQAFISQIERGIRPIPDYFIEKIEADISKVNTSAITKEPPRHVIPFYDDVASVGGNSNLVAGTESVSTPTEYIDAGDWFKDATAAIRHYGESMAEYPSGCILALKEVKDRELIIPGRDYCIETSEYRVTKRLQKGKSSEYITAYSTNKETYPDGRMVHEPFDIPWRAINNISLVLGYVVKKNGGTMIYNSNRK